MYIHVNRFRTARRYCTRGSRIWQQLFTAGYLALLLSASGCATFELFPSKPEDVPSGSDQELMSQGEADIALKKYDEGRKHLQRLINHFPESELVPGARLSVARSYFDEKRYDEARAEYQRFIELFPRHEQVDEAQYYTGLSYFRQMEKVDRDQTMTIKAVREFRSLISEFPDSQFAPDARMKLAESLRQRVQRELYVGKFYFSQEAYGAAIPRFESILKEYPGSEYADQALYYLGASLWELEQKAPAKAAFQRLIAEFPNSDLAPMAAQQIGMAFVQDPRNRKPSPSFLSGAFASIPEVLSELKDAIMDNPLWQAAGP
ncbi:MAG: outer membrane protein assembly factor BamD [Candidatus Methylomirabilota bacterium]|nr:MAG: outer membrane protein assembly factor BamD [candidate division NC10 bacterium]